MKRWSFILIAGLVVASVALGACGDSEGEPSESTSQKLKSSDPDKRKEGVRDAEKKYK